jgi:hypothetical protein
MRTENDKLLMAGVDGAEARRRVRDHVDGVLDRRRRE